MYSRIEDEFKKKNELRKFLYHSCVGMGVILTFIYISFVIFFKIHFILLFLLTIFIQIISYTIYFLIITKSSLKNIKQFKSNIARHLHSLYQKDFDTLVAILINENITRKDELALLINHYKDKISYPSPTRLKDLIITISTAAIPIMLGYYDIQTKTLNLKSLLIDIPFMFSVIIMLISPYIIYKLLYNINFDSNNYILIELEDKLSQIYIDFDTYKKELNIKTTNKKELL